jgi:hypothetical protein
MKKNSNKVDWMAWAFISILLFGMTLVMGMVWYSYQDNQPPDWVTESFSQPPQVSQNFLNNLKIVDTTDNSTISYSEYQERVKCQ